MQSKILIQPYILKIELYYVILCNIKLTNQYFKLSNAINNILHTHSRLHRYIFERKGMASKIHVTKTALLLRV